MKWVTRFSVFLAVVFVILGFAAAGYVRYMPPSRYDATPNTLSDLGNYGSYLQGTTASLWTLAGVLAAVAAFYLQVNQLRDQQKEIREQQRQIKLQNFESSFFQLLGLHNQIVAAMECYDSIGTPNAAGRTCFEHWFKALRNNFKANSVDERYAKFYPHYQATLGHYFRNLYHLIKFVNDTDALHSDDPKEDYRNRRRYTSIVRGQLSAYELVSLLYNGRSSWGEKFKPLIEKYGLLEHLDKGLLLTPPDDKVYHTSAFE